MDGDRLDLEVVTPERLVVSETVESVVLPGSQGSLGVLPGHAPLLTGLGVGELSYRKDGQTQFLSVAGGYAEVLRNRVTVLADTCERAEEIDPQRAQRSKDNAVAVIQHAADLELIEARLRLLKAQTRLDVRRRRS